MTDQQLYLIVGLQGLAICFGTLGNILFLVWHTKRQIRRFRQER